MDAVPFAHLQGLTQQMLEAACQGDWDGLVEAETARAALMDDWQAGVVQVSNLEPAGLETIMAIDAQVLQLVQARQQEIGRQLGEFRLGQRMTLAYRNAAG